MVEHDVIPHDTGYIPYLVVSALALDAMVIAGILGAMATAREFEYGTVKLLRLSPASQAVMLAGKLAVAAAVAASSLAVTLLRIRFEYGGARGPRTTAFTLLACGNLHVSGAWIGALQADPAVPLLFGPRCRSIDSGAEPTRFDGE
jgi:ABC-type transport system involved in cytochrome c biogenesis permease component